MPLCITKYKKDQTIPNPTRHPAPGAGHGHLPPWILQCSPNWSLSLCCETSTDGPECGGASAPKRAHVTPLFIELHWLPLAARIKFKSLMLAYKVLNRTAPIYLNALAKAYVTTRSLRSSQDCRLAVPTPRLRQSRLFSCVVPRWWNDLPSATRTGASLSIFKKLLKTQLFREHLLS